MSMVRYLRDPMVCLFRLVLATLLQRYRLPLESLRPDEGKVRAANVGPAHGVRMVVEERLA